MKRMEVTLYRSSAPERRGTLAGRWIPVCRRQECGKPAAGQTGRETDLQPPGQPSSSSCSPARRRGRSDSWCRPCRPRPWPSWRRIPRRWPRACLPRGRCTYWQPQGGRSSCTPLWPTPSPPCARNTEHRPCKDDLHLLLDHLAQQEVQPFLHEDFDLLPVLGLDLLLGLAGEVGRALADPTQHQGVSLISHGPRYLAGLPVDGLHPDLHSCLVSSVDELVLAGVEGEGLHDVGPGSQELPVQLLDGLGLLHGGLGGPGPGLDVASLLQLKHKTAISYDWASGQALKNSLHRRESVSTAWGRHGDPGDINITL